MMTKADFQRAIRDTISGYPYASLLYQAGDPRLLAQLDAIATMMSMISQQMEVAMMEPFSKSRDATVLADACLKGIVPMAVPAQITLTGSNPTNAAWPVAAGRQLYDSSGNIWVVLSATSLPAASGSTPGTAAITVQQLTTRAVPVTIGTSAPFYSVQVPSPPNEDNYICGIVVTRNSDGLQFTYQPNFVNVNPGDTVYTVETDEYRNLYVKFGYQDVVGYQPPSGETYTLTVSDTAGAVTPAAGSPFSLEYLTLPQDSQMSFAMAAQTVPGAAPMTIAALREMAKYPSVYDVNAVYLGEFDRMIRLAVPNLNFLSVWNEQLEEQVRGANENNVNKLFIAVEPPTGGDLTATKAAIQQAVQQADDSYAIVWVTPVDTMVGCTVVMKVSIVNDPGIVTSQTDAAILGVYGNGTPPTTRGMLNMQVKAITTAIDADVDAMQDATADRTVALTLPATLLPEQHLYIDPSTISVTVIPQTQNNGNWGV